MNVVFMGTPDYAVRILRHLKEAGFNIKAIFTQPDKPVGRKQILTPSEVKIYAQNELVGVPVFTPNTLKDESVVAELKAFEPKFIVVAAYGKILPRSVLDVATCINLHASILPKYRGASPIQSAILAGEKQTGVTAMLMDTGLDTGDMLDFIYTPCESKMSSELFNELGELGGELIVKVLKNFENLKPQKQDDAQATHCKKISKSDGLFSFDEDVGQIYNKFRALTPWPGIYLESGLKILSLEPSEKSGKSGEILSVEKDHVVVACKGGAVKIYEFQEPSKKSTNAKAYINGKRLSVGDKIE
ncbi:methionyl-tRNA formyltransferase [Campylobacter concisus]|uniref:Methionyl-tRNA formyltransferase n=1 Tax=Campylobacter concisus TaxID=199 RepID=A0A0M5MKA0_9BACT|nr:methionyl-tRNA formyltransferase [Campylobacter concisus]ALF47150.1 10-formyltetrahydrofolate:L-methionyl-tRNA(fMet) N-formyltransferase [Campylobacter concisus]